MTTGVSVVLARLLEPEHYGVISIVMIFITLANVFVSSGLGSALIQKKDADELDYSTVLVSNITLALFLYCILFLSAPFIAAYYGEGYDILAPVIRVLGVRLLLSSVNSVQHAYVAKNMIFHKFFVATLFGTVVSAVVGITMAFFGYGVWALVAQYLTNTTIDTIILYFSLHIRLSLRFSFQRFKSLFSYGITVLGTSLLIQGYTELSALIIGKVYSSADLAYFSKGKQFPHLIITNINTSISAVLFPKLANEQDNIEKVKQTMRKSIRFSSYLMTPCMLGFAAIAESFISVLLTDKWLPTVPLLRLFCIVYLFYPIHTANAQAIKAIGRSDIYFKLELSKKSIELIVLLITMHISVTAITWGMAICATVFTYANALPNAKLLNYTFKEQVIDIFEPVAMSALMFVCVWLLGKLSIPKFPLMCMQIIIGAGIYLSLSLLTNNKEFIFIRNTLKAKKLRL